MLKNNINFSGVLYIFTFIIVITTTCTTTTRLASTCTFFLLILLYRKSVSQNGKKSASDLMRSTLCTSTHFLALFESGLAGFLSSACFSLLGGYQQVRCVPEDTGSNPSKLICVKALGRGQQPSPRKEPFERVFCSKENTGSHKSRVSHTYE